MAYAVLSLMMVIIIIIIIIIIIYCRISDEGYTGKFRKKYYGLIKILSLKWG